MQMFNTPERYGAVVQFLHWTSAFLVAVAWLLGTFGDDLPRGAAADRALARSVKEVHETLANVLMVVAGIHAAAALLHHWVLRDRTLKRMLFGTSR